MANIRNSISLQDRMTPVFRSIIKSMDSTMRVMRNLDKQANKGVQSKAYRAAERDIKRANNELIKMQNHLNRADRAAGKLATSTDRVAQNSARMSHGGLNLTNLASGLYLLKNIANTISDIMATPDTTNAIKYRLETYDTSDATGKQLFSAAYDAAQRSRSELESTANLASRILISGATKGNGAAAINLAEILNKASFLGGSSSQESQRALLQLSQGLASGMLQGDELRAIREQAPGLTDVLARGLSSLGEKGILDKKFIGTTMGDLKELGAEGELTAGRIIAAFQEMEDYVDTAFEDSPKQFGQAMTAIGNVWKRWLTSMSEGDNAFAKLTNKAWELAEWFESDAGERFFYKLTVAVNALVDGFLWLIEGISNVIEWFNSLDNSAELVQSALITLGVVGAAAIIAWVVQLVVANWQVILLIAGVYALIYALMAMGLTAGEVTGGIAGGLLFLGYLIYDLVLWIITIVGFLLVCIWDGLLGLVSVITTILTWILWGVVALVQGIIQLIIWLALGIGAIIVGVIDTICTILAFIDEVIKGLILGVYALFVGIAEAVLGVLWGIASVIDLIFGTKLADSVEGAMSGLANSLKDLEAELEIGARLEGSFDQWENHIGTFGEMFTGEGEFDSLNITDNMADTFNAFKDFDSAQGEFFMKGIVNPLDIGQWGVDNTINPLDGWNAGMQGGQELDNILAKLDEQQQKSEEYDPSKMEEYLKNFQNDGLSVNGGTLDGIKSDVDISEEDIQLLRDIAARDFLLNLQTVTPTANIKFGDVRETADVNKILEVIQDMVDEELATSLVVN